MRLISLMHILPALFLAGAFAVPAMAQTTKEAPAAGENNDPVLARVGDNEIHLTDLMREAQTLPQQYRSMPLQSIFEPLLQRMIARVLVVNAAEAKELDKRKDVAQEIMRNRAVLLQQVYMQELVGPGVSDADVKAYYEKEVASQPGTSEVRARHILLETEAEAKLLAEKAQKGEDFAALAAAHSTGPSKSQGGDLGFFKAGDMVPAFSEAAFAMKPGEVSDPVKTRFGWHVIKVEERREAQPPGLEESQEEIRQQLSQAAMQNEIERLRAGVKVELFNPDGTPRTTEAGAETESKKE